MLCGTKLDLVEIVDYRVNSDDAKELASQNNMGYYEISALKGEKIDDMIKDTIELVYLLKILLGKEMAKKTGKVETPAINLD